MIDDPVSPYRRWSRRPRQRPPRVRPGHDRQPRPSGHGLGHLPLV